MVYPAAWYHGLGFVAALVTEVSAFPVVLLVIVQQWLWLALCIGVAVLVNLVAAAFLNSRATVVMDELDPVSRKEVFGRWYPK